MIDNWLISLMYKMFTQMNKKKKNPPKCISQDPVRKTETMLGNSNREN